ncbi:MAG: toxin-antitoxin system HicB family antitoxin, partial [bacterium]|nr:toxin-antitoxin system HicB family antitoxin [bacterium]
MKVNKIADKDYPFIVYREKGTGYYIAEFPDLPGCYTQAESLEKLIKNLNDAKYSWIKTALDFGKDVQAPTDFEFSGRFTVRLPKTLHQELKSAASSEGLSLNQYISYRLSEKKKYYTKPIKKPTNKLTGTEANSLILRVPRTLHRALVEKALLEGVSLNQFIMNLLAEFKMEEEPFFIPNYRNESSIGK